MDDNNAKPNKNRNDDDHEHDCEKGNEGEPIHACCNDLNCLTKTTCIENESKHDNNHYHSHEHSHFHSHHHSHDHNHQSPCTQCTPNSEPTTITSSTSAPDLDDVEIPSWKKRAIEANLDFNMAPFQMKDWNTETSFSIVRCCGNDDNDVGEGFVVHEKSKIGIVCGDNEHSHEHNHEHSHEHSKSDNEKHDLGCCSKKHTEQHYHDHEHNHKGGCCHSEGDHHHNHDHGHSHTHDHDHDHDQSFIRQTTRHPKPVYVAIIREQTVDVYDIKGDLKSFKYRYDAEEYNITTGTPLLSTTILKKSTVADIMRKICFSSHGVNNVDSILTPCFDKNGCHGRPESTCFCGVDEPHIHAHFRDDIICGDDDEKMEKNGDDDGHGMDVVKLASLILYPEDDENQPQQLDPTLSNAKGCRKNYKQSKSMPLSESLPVQCNSKEYKKMLSDRGITHGDDESMRQKMFKVLHHDHYDILVHNENTGNLQLEHNCDDCGDTDIHGKLDLVYQRTLNGYTSNLDVRGNEMDAKKGNVRLNFYNIPKKTFGLLDTFMTDLFRTDSTDRVNIVRQVVSPKRRLVAKTSVSKCCNSSDYCETTDLLKNDEFYMKANYSSDAISDVQSKIFVKHICCASEIPIINKVLNPIPGVSNVKVNTTTKIVYVTHDMKKVSAPDIVSALNKEKFGAILKSDGAVSLRAPLDISSISVQSKFFVQHICCASEIPMINDIVRPLLGVTEVRVNTLTKMVYVSHDPKKVCAENIEAALNKANFGAKLEIDGFVKLQESQVISKISQPSEMNQNRSLKFVESTFLALSLFDDNVKRHVIEILRNQYTKEQISHVDAHVMSRTIKVDHNPYLVKAESIKNVLSDHNVDVSIHTNGFDEGIWAMKTDDDDLEHQKAKLHWNVALAGVFWVLSLFYLIGGNWHYLEYLGLVSVVLGIPNIALKAFTTLRRLQFDTNCMMLFATMGAIALQDYTEAAAVAFLFSLSEWLESLSTARARNALSSIAKLRPERARVKDEATNTFRIVPATAVAIGSIVAVPTGDKVPCDGVVVGGTSTMDESSLTGESRPIKKDVGDTVAGGTINSGRAQLLVKTTSLADDSAVARLIRLVEEAQTNRSPTEQLIDEFAKRYTPIVVLAALSMCTFPWIVGVETGREWTEIGLITIVIACPCALIISTPVTYVAGIAAAAQKGIVVKGGVHLEAIARVSRIAFDKTGTLTEGNFKLLHLRELHPSMNRLDTYQYLYAMEENASHPLAVALVSAAKAENVSIPDNWSIQNHTILDGEGVTAKVNGNDVHVGNTRLFERLGLLESVSDEEINIAKEWMENGGTVGFLSIEGFGIVGSYCVCDSLRQEARDVVNGIRELNIEPVMLTGDNHKAALCIGKNIGLSTGNIKSQLLPQEKLQYIKDAVAESNNRTIKKSCLSIRRRNDLILMCGDGVNDAPALTLADVGVAMGAGAAIAMESADVTLLDSDLRKLLHLVKLSKRVSRTIIENVTFSLVAKAVVMALTFAGYTNLWAAIGSDVGAMLIVTANGMKLLPSKRSIKNQSGYDARKIEGGSDEGVDTGDIEDQKMFPLVLEK